MSYPEFRKFRIKLTGAAYARLYHLMSNCKTRTAPLDAVLRTLLLTVNIASKLNFVMMSEKSDVEGIGNSEHYSH